MNRIVILLFIAFFVSEAPASAQKTSFKIYTDSIRRFSLDIPEAWQIQYNDKKGGYIGTTTNKEEQELLDNCYNGVMFRLNSYKPGLKHLHGEKIKGVNWIGLYYKFPRVHTCIPLENGSVNQYMGICEFIYFSNNRRTICFRSNATEIDESVRKRMITSFRFF